VPQKGAEEKDKETMNLSRMKEEEIPSKMTNETKLLSFALWIHRRRIHFIH